ncbi:MAG: hypothetical protein KAS32_13960 [Candidatus Peribacteraceae bacterium]|nr:hypothetical protein [Candidatus Peribacteraceae bacterium]
MKKPISSIILILCIMLPLTGCFEQQPPPLPNYPSIMPSGEIENGNMTLYMGWNLVSMPVSIPRDNISFTYEGMPYTWAEAVDNNYIWNVLWAFNGTNYIMADFLIRTRGYWLGCKVEPIYISDELLVICCNGIEFDDNASDIVCNKVIVSNLYETHLVVKSITYDSIEFYYLSDGVLEG